MATPERTIRIAKLEQIIPAKPTLWIAVTDPCPCCGLRQQLGIRYRWGVMTISIAIDEEEELLFEWNGIAERGDSEMTLDELRRLLPDSIRIDEEANGA